MEVFNEMHPIMLKITELNILEMFTPLNGYLPEIIPPKHNIRLGIKLFWTTITLLIYLICCEIPIVGVMPSNTADPYHWMRAITASNRGSLMELGIMPIATAGLTLEFLQVAKLIKLRNKKEVDLYKTADKILSTIIAIVMALFNVVTGMFGRPSQLGFMVCVLIVLQLAFASFMVIILDEMLSKGYGIGSAIPLFNATHVCTGVMWKAFSPTTVDRGRGVEFEGCLVALFHLLLVRQDRKEALSEVFFRTHLPSLTGLMYTFFMFAIVIYLQGFHVNIPIKSVMKRGLVQRHPVKLFYTSTQPLMLQHTFMFQLFAISRALSSSFGSIFNVVGTWIPESPYPVGGLCYYLTQPDSMIGAPGHALAYVMFMLASCAVLSVKYMKISGRSPDDVSQRLLECNKTIVGCKPQFLRHEIGRYIMTAAIFGGLCTAALSIIGNAVGVLVSGSSIFLAVTAIQQYVSVFFREYYLIDCSSF